MSSAGGWWTWSRVWIIVCLTVAVGSAVGSRIPVVDKPTMIAAMASFAWLAFIGVIVPVGIWVESHKFMMPAMMPTRSPTKGLGTPGSLWATMSAARQTMLAAHAAEVERWVLCSSRHLERVKPGTRGLLIYDVGRHLVSVGAVGAVAFPVVRTLDELGLHVPHPYTELSVEDTRRLRAMLRNERSKR